MDERARDAKVRSVGRVKSEELTQVEAAEILGLSYRQTKRLYRRFLKLGIEAPDHPWRKPYLAAQGR